MQLMFLERLGKFMTETKYSANLCLQYTRSPSWNGLLQVLDDIESNVVPFLYEIMNTLSCRFWR
jgi:hypothetical protein